MHRAHRANPISDEDLRYTLAGGFSPGDLDRRLAAVGCRGWYRPTGLLHYLATRASQIFFGTPSRFDLGRRMWRSAPDGVGQELAWAYRRLLEALLRADHWLERLPQARENRMRLVWGFDKPAEPDASATANASFRAQAEQFRSEA